MPGEPIKDEIGSCLKAKSLRTRPYLYAPLRNYRYLVFADSKIAGEIHDETTLKILASMPSEAAIVHRRHFLFADGAPVSVWSELDLSMEQERYRTQANQMRSYIKQKVAAGYNSTKNIPHLMGGYIIRDMKNPVVRDIGQDWFQNILSCGIQDQISLFFVHQDYLPFIHTIPPYPI